MEQLQHHFWIALSSLGQPVPLVTYAVTDITPTEISGEQGPCGQGPSC